MNEDQLISALLILGWELMHHNIVKNLKYSKGGIFYRLLILKYNKSVILQTNNKPVFDLKSTRSTINSYEEALRVVVKL